MFDLLDFSAPLQFYPEGSSAPMESKLISSFDFKGESLYLIETPIGYALVDEKGNPRKLSWTSRPGRVLNQKAEVQGYINVFADGSVSQPYRTRSEADRSIPLRKLDSPRRISCLAFTAKEGEFDV